MKNARTNSFALTSLGKLPTCSCSKTSFTFIMETAKFPWKRCLQANARSARLFKNLALWASFDFFSSATDSGGTLNSNSILTFSSSQTTDRTVELRNSRSPAGFQLSYQHPGTTARPHSDLSCQMAGRRSKGKEFGKPCRNCSPIGGSALALYREDS